MSISTKEELQFLIHRAWEIEKKFESFSAWKGFVSMGSTHRPTVLTLARESYMHRLNLEKLLKTLDLEAPQTKFLTELLISQVCLTPRYSKKLSNRMR